MFIPMTTDYSLKYSDEQIIDCDNIYLRQQKIHLSSENSYYPYFYILNLKVAFLPSKSVCQLLICLLI